MNNPFRFRLLFAFLMSLFMSFLMSAWVTWLNLGLRPDFLERWAHSFVAAWPAAFFVVVFFGPGFQALTHRLLHLASKNRGGMR